MVWIFNYSIYIVKILLYVRYVRSLDGNENTYYIQTKSVEEFKRLCPFTDLCYSKASRNFTRNGVPDYPCCSACECDVSSDTTNCPDIPERFLNEAEVFQMKQTSEKCVRAQLRRYSSYKVNGKSYKMIGNCPADYKDPDIKSKCSREYHDFDFEKDDVTTLMPVSSASLNVTFRNYYCVVCHGAEQTKLNFWEAKVTCHNQRTLLFSNVYEIPSRLSEEPLCQLKFEPSHDIPVHTCNSIVDGCNVTGTWKRYDKTLESACLSYTSVYKNFKNIHCYLCNGHSFTDIEELCGSNDLNTGYESFVALLDFNDLEGPSNERQTGETKCPRNSKYDPYKKECRSLSCPYGMMLSKEQCIPLFKSVTNFEDENIVFGLRMNFFRTTTKIIGWRHYKLLISSVLNELLAKMSLMFTSFDVSICAFNSYIKLKHSLEDTVYYMGLNNSTDFTPFVSHLAVFVEFNVRSAINISETLDEMTMIFTSNDNYAQYSVQYPADNYEIPMEMDHHNASDEFLDIILSFDLPEYFMFSSGINDPDDGLGILWFLDDDLFPVLPTTACDAAMLIQPNPFCPRVKLERSELNIDVVRPRIATLETNNSSLHLIFSNILSSKGNSVFVCAKEYFSQLPSKEASKVNYTLFILTIFCLVPSITSLLLSFLAYCALPRLRNIPGLNNMALVFHLLLAQSLAFVNIFTDIELSWLCSAIGIVLHYTLLASFFWMFICTLHMMTVFVQIKERSTGTHTMRKFVHYLIFAEMVPVLLVISNVVVSILSDDAQANFGYGGSSCYIRRSNMILFFVAIPLGVVLTLNLIMFTFVVWHVARLPDMTKNSNHERKNVLIFAKLSTLTGITWIFGFLYQFFDIDLFAYCYILFNAGQGIFIMISFVINKRVFDMLHARCHKKPREKSEGTTYPFTVSSIIRNKSISGHADTKF